MDANTPPPISTPIPPGESPHQAKDDQFARQEKAEKLANASKIIGIIALILFPISMILAIIGLILGLVGKGEGSKKISGIVMNAVAIPLNIISIIVLAFSIANLTFNMIDSAISKNNQLVCTRSVSGDSITIAYDDNDVIGYLSNTSYIEVDLDKAHEIIEKHSLSFYLTQFASDFEDTWADGTCNTIIKNQ